MQTGLSALISNWHASLVRCQVDKYINVFSSDSLQSSDINASRSKVVSMAVSQSTATAIAQATTVDIFNESDTSKRRQMMEKVWSPNIIGYLPHKAYTGFDELDQSREELMAGEMVDFRFSIAGQVRVNHNLIYLGWEFGPGGKAGEKGLKGWDVIIVGQDEKVEVFYGIFEGPPTPQ